MNILVIGQGGREHAIAWKLQQSEKVTEAFVAPGNGGTELETGCTNIDISSNDFPMIKSFVEENNIELVVVGPEDPLVNGIKDYLSNSNVLVFGPDAKGAQLEGSKIFSKEFLFENSIPTGEAAFFSSSLSVDISCSIFIDVGITNEPKLFAISSSSLSFWFDFSLSLTLPI